MQTIIRILLTISLSLGLISAQYIGHDNGSSYTDIFGTTRYSGW